MPHKCLINLFINLVQVHIHEINTVGGESLVQLFKRFTFVICS